SATGSMRGDTRNKRSGKFLHVRSMEEQINRAFAGQMSALKQDARAKFFTQLSSHTAHFIEIAHRFAAQGRGFRHVRRYQSGSAKKAPSIRVDSLRSKQGIAACGDHYRVDHQWNAFRFFLDEARDHFH